MIIKWSNLSLWEIVLFWMIISATVVFTVMLADAVSPPHHWHPPHPCDNQGTLCVVA